MSISFNHPKNIVTSTGTLNLVVSGGSTTSPQPIRFSSTSVIMPVRPLPTGEAGAMVFDSSSKVLKYHDGLSWIDILSKDTILEPIYTQLNQIQTKLGTKVDSVSYISGAVPQATISGTQLNIVFPLGSGGGSGAANGLFTSSKRGAIQHYALQSGQNAADIRAQMSGATNGQAGRNGTQASPWISNDGWCFADGMYWTWTGESGTVTQLVPNLNNAAYLKPMALSGVTQIGSMINATGSVGSTSLSIAQLPPLTFTVSGTTSSNGSHIHTQLYNPMGWSGTSNVKDGTGRNSGSGSRTTEAAGDHIHTFTGTTNTLGSGQGHSHDLLTVDVAHYNVAVIYNIATPSYALNETAANSKYVLKSGDVMTGSLTIASAANVKGADTNLTFAFRNASNGERAMIYHSSATNTLRLRSSGGSEVTISNTGALVVPGTATITGNTTVGGKNVVRSVNGVNADAAGAVTISAGIQDIRLGTTVSFNTNVRPSPHTTMLPSGYVNIGSKSNYNDSNWELDTVYAAPIEKQVNGQWYVVNKL